MAETATVTSSKQYSALKRHRKHSQMGSISVPGIDKIVEDGEEKLIAYHSSATSIYVNESKYDDPVKEVPHENITFLGGIKDVPEEDKVLVSYLEKTNYNQSNENRKNTVQPIFMSKELETEAEKYNAPHEKVAEATMNIKTLDTEKLKAMLLVNTGIPVDQITQMEKEEVKNNCYKIVRRDPHVFLEENLSDKDRNKLLVLTGVQKRTLEIDDSTGQEILSWRGGNEIVRAPRGHSVVEFFAELLTKDTKYDDIKNELADRMDTSKISKTQEEGEKKESGDWKDGMIDDLVSKGVLNDKKTWIYLVGSDRKWNGRKALKKEMDESPELIAELMSEGKKDKNEAKKKEDEEEGDSMPF